jgi:hypothetical protein
MNCDETLRKHLPALHLQVRSRNLAELMCLGKSHAEDSDVNLGLWLWALRKNTRYSINPTFVIGYFGSHYPSILWHFIPNFEITYRIWRTLVLLCQFDYLQYY